MAKVRFIFLLTISSLMVVPILVVLFSVFTPTKDIWLHLFNTVLGDYLTNSLILAVGTTTGVVLLGVPAAWIIAMCSFPGKKIFSWALLLPLSMPTYIIAYTYTGILDVSGWVQTSLRDLTSLQYGEYFFPDIRSMGGAIIMLSLTLYPYVYLLSRTAFMAQPQSSLEVGESLGFSKLKCFLYISLPLARPAIIAGVALVLMETLAEFGTMQYFGVQSFTTGIYRTWFGMGDSNAAAQLASVLLIFIFVLLVAERYSRKKMGYAQKASIYSSPPNNLKGKYVYLVWLLCSIPIVIGFIIPALQLIYWSIYSSNTHFETSFWELVFNSLLLAFIAALFITFLAILISYAKRSSKSTFIKTTAMISSTGYALPGVVVALGVYIPFIWLDTLIQKYVMDWFAIDIGLFLSGSLFVLVFAYSVRFLAISLNSVDSGFLRITNSIDDAGRSLGFSYPKILFKLHIPMMKGSVLAALLLAFIDVLKELPATLILRPFNFNTLAVRAYEMAAEERLADAGLPALIIVACGLIPVILISKFINNSQTNLNK